MLAPLLDKQKAHELAFLMVLLLAYTMVHMKVDSIRMVRMKEGQLGLRLVRAYELAQMTASQWACV